MSKWSELAKTKPEDMTDAKRVAMVAVVHISTREMRGRPHLTMDQIFAELLAEYDLLFSHCDPKDARGDGGKGPIPRDSHEENEA